jgi:hypothetical protein
MAMMTGAAGGTVSGYPSDLKTQIAFARSIVRDDATAVCRVGLG